MKKPILIHAAWLLVAAGTFAAGRYMMPSASDTVAENEESTQTRLLNSTSNPGRASSAGSTAKGSGASTGANGSYSVAGAISALQNEKDPLKKNLLLAEILMNMTAENAQDVLAMLQEDRGRDSGRQMGLFFQAWGKLDGEAAVTAALAMNEGGDRGGRGGFGGGMYAAAAISAWAKTDQGAAEVWLDSQEDGRDKTMLKMGYVNGLAESDPDAATSYVLAMLDKEGASTEEGGDRRGFDINGRYFDTITRQQLERGLDVAKDWADGLPDGAFKSAALDDIADRMAREDIEGAKEWIAKYADQDFAKDAVGEIAQRMSRDDPKAAVDWVLSLPEASQGRALYSAFNEWTQKDVTAASDFLAQMPASDTKDSAVYGLVRELDGEDPASAAAWAVTIQDEQMRQRSVMEVAGNWYKEDQAAATNFMTQNGVSEDMQKMIISRSARGGGGGPGGRGGREGR